MRILEEFWYGNIEPTEYDTSSKEYKKLLELICRNEEKLKATMTDEQKELFEKYTDCVREYQTITDCLIFQNSFKLGARMMLAVMEEYVFNAVPTTDWGSAETLEFWREQWAVMCNAKFEEKGLDVRIDHRSYERQGIELLPTVHEGPTVRAMEKKGIKTEKGEFNRWIRATNAFIRNLRKNLSILLETIKEIKAELDKPQSDPVIIPLQRYFDMRNAKAYSQKARLSNLKELNEMVNYLKASEIYTIEDLESRVSTLKDTVDELKITMDTETARMKEMRKMPEYVATLQELKPIVDGLQKIKFDKAKTKYKAEHEKELNQYYAVRRKLLEVCPDGKYDGKLLDKEYAALETAHAETYAKFVAIREEYQRIWHIQSCVERGLGNTEQTQQKKDNRKQEER